MPADRYRPGHLARALTRLDTRGPAASAASDAEGLDHTHPDTLAEHRMRMTTNPPGLVESPVRWKGTPGSGGDQQGTHQQRTHQR